MTVRFPAAALDGLLTSTLPLLKGAYNLEFDAYEEDKLRLIDANAGSQRTTLDLVLTPEGYAYQGHVSGAAPYLAALIERICKPGADPHRADHRSMSANDLAHIAQHRRSRAAA